MIDGRGRREADRRPEHFRFADRFHEKREMLQARILTPEHERMMIDERGEIMTLIVGVRLVTIGIVRRYTFFYFEPLF